MPNELALRVRQAGPAPLTHRWKTAMPAITALRQKAEKRTAATARSGTVVGRPPIRKVR